MEKVLNPFRYLSLRNAWCWGIVALILSTILSWLIGIPECCGKSIWIAAACITAAWLINAVIMYAVGDMVSKSKVRFTDVAAFLLFASIPKIIVQLLFAIPIVNRIGVMQLAGYDTSALIEQHLPLMLKVSILLVILLVWIVFWEYKAFSESTNVKNGKGVVCFVLICILCSIVIDILWEIFVNS